MSLASAVAFVALVTAASPVAAARRNPLHTAAGITSAVQVVEPGTVVAVTDPGVELTVPVDGRLRGDGVALVVTGAALTDRAGHGNDVVSAGRGQHLIVFGVRQVPQPASETGAPPTLALIVDGQRLIVGLGAVSGSNPDYFVASIPDATTAVSLELSAAGFSQDFNLMTLSRTGPSPVVLYRDPDNADADTALDASVNVGATVPEDPGQSYTDTITVPTVTLSYFAPTPAADPAPALDEAYLEINATEKPVVDIYGGHDVHFGAPIPTNLVHLALPDGTTVAATDTGCTCDDPDIYDYVVATTYYFAVPAGITTATLRVDAYQGAGFEYQNETGLGQTIALDGFTIPLTLNPPPAPPLVTPPTTVLTLTHTEDVAAGTGTGGAATPSRSPDQAPLWIVAILVAAAGAVTWTTVRRRHRPPAIAAGPSYAPRPRSTDLTAVTVASRPAPVVSDVDVRVDPPERPPPPSAPVSHPPTPTAATLPFPDLPPAEPTEPAGALPVPDESEGISLGLLGPREITGPGTDKLRPRDLEVFVFLAVNADRSVTNDDIRAAVAGATDEESNAKTVRTWLSRIRSAVGSTVLPEADNGRYRLNAVCTDIDDFEELTAQSTDTDTAEASDRLRQALTLVRGRPFEGLDYRWTHITVAHLEARITDAANRLAALSLEHHDPTTAVWAARRGLDAVVQPDDRLVGHLLRAAADQGSAQLNQAWREVTARYAAVGDAPTPDITALSDRLRNPETRR